MHKILSILLLFFFISLSAQEEKPKRFFANGYVSSMQSVMFDSINNAWTENSYINNRLNLSLDVSKRITAVAEMRNRFIYGDNIRFDPTNNYVSDFEKDNGFMDLNFNYAHGKSYLINTNIDRLYLAYKQDKLDITVGRQRINWGQTFAWNPNDIFNAYSFFDFDYIERPGSDAVRIQYYNTVTSVIELAMKIDRAEDITAAGFYRFNKWGTDIQFLGGVFNSSDYVAGAGFAGNIKSIALRGEATYLHPMDNFEDTSGIMLISLQTDYSFSNSLTLSAEYFYNQSPGIDFNKFATSYNTQLNIKTLSFVKHNFFLSVSYPLTPLLSGTLSGMLFPQLDGYYVGPSLSYSLADNVDFSFIAQGFSLKDEITDSRLALILAFMRFKVNF